VGVKIVLDAEGAATEYLYFDKKSSTAFSGRVGVQILFYLSMVPRRLSPFTANNIFRNILIEISAHIIVS
jgi:hypothetical protein